MPEKYDTCFICHFQFPEKELTIIKDPHGFGSVVVCLECAKVAKKKK